MTRIAMASSIGAAFANGFTPGRDERAAGNFSEKFGADLAQNLVLLSIAPSINEYGTARL
jgi:hypothetical protein